MIRPTPPRVHVRRVTEVVRPGNPAYWTHPEWEVQFPWLVQGITGRAATGREESWDFGLFSTPPAPGASESWEGLGEALGFSRIAHSRQVHEGTVTLHGSHSSHQMGEAPGLLHTRTPRLRLGPDADGHLTATTGTLLGVTVADCVPVFLVDPEERAIGLLHAGWRGTVAGILERGLHLLTAKFGSAPGKLHLHLGPSICGECYEVGSEVHRALGLPMPKGPKPVDLRGQLASRALGLGVEGDRVTESAWCTLCGGSPFYSHRRGDSGRQVGFLGIPPADGPPLGSDPSC